VRLQLGTHSVDVFHTPVLPAAFVVDHALSRKDQSPIRGSSPILEGASTAKEGDTLTVYTSPLQTTEPGGECRCSNSSG
jgi:hypothetical protein